MFHSTTGQIKTLVVLSCSRCSIRSWKPVKLPRLLMAARLEFPISWAQWVQVFFVSVQLHFSTVWWHACSAFLISDIYLSFFFFVLFDDRHSAYFFAISAPSPPSTMFPLPMLDYVMLVFLHWTQGFAVVVIVIFQHLAQFLELSLLRWPPPLSFALCSLKVHMDATCCTALRMASTSLCERQKHRQKNI